MHFPPAFETSSQRQLSLFDSKTRVLTRKLGLLRHFLVMREPRLPVAPTINLTAQEDVAEVVALAVSNRERFGDVRYYGSSMSTRELTDLYNMISGEKLEPKCLGSLEDLKNRKAENCGKDMGMDLLCSFLLPLYDGRGLIKDTNINDIGQVKLMNVEEFLKRSQQKGFQYEFPITELSKKFQQICGSK